MAAVAVLALAPAAAGFVGEKASVTPPPRRLPNANRNRPEPCPRRRVQSPFWFSGTVAASGGANHACAGDARHADGRASLDAHGDGARPVHVHDLAARHDGPVRRYADGATARHAHSRGAIRRPRRIAHTPTSRRSATGAWKRVERPVAAPPSLQLVRGAEPAGGDVGLDVVSDPLRLDVRVSEADPGQMRASSTAAVRSEKRWKVRCSPGKRLLVA